MTAGYPCTVANSLEDRLCLKLCVAIFERKREMTKTEDKENDENQMMSIFALVGELSNIE